MPIPTPTPDEKESEFLVRCMADSTMVDEYKDNAQRYAVCLTSWEDSDRESEDKAKA